MSGRATCPACGTRLTVRANDTLPVHGGRKIENADGRAAAAWEDTCRGSGISLAPVVTADVDPDETCTEMFARLRREWDAVDAPAPVSTPSRVRTPRAPQERTVSRFTERFTLLSDVLAALSHVEPVMTASGKYPHLSLDLAGETLCGRPTVGNREAPRDELTCPHCLRAAERTSR